MLSKLPQLPRDVGPTQLLGHFAAVLAGAYGTGLVEIQSRSVKVDFPRLGLAVDAVPARPCLGSPYIEIPDRFWRLGDDEPGGAHRADNGDEQPL